MIELVKEQEILDIECRLPRILWRRNTGVGKCIRIRSAREALS
jgi:hypothetical protein